MNILKKRSKWRSVKRDGYPEKEDAYYWCVYTYSDGEKPFVSGKTVYGGDIKESLFDLYMEVEKPKIDYREENNINKLRKYMDDKDITYEDLIFWTFYSVVGVLSLSYAVYIYEDFWFI